MDVLSGGLPRNLVRDEIETLIGPMATAAGPVFIQAGSGFSVFGRPGRLRFVQDACPVHLSKDRAANPARNKC